MFSCYGSQFSAKEQKSTCSRHDDNFILFVRILENSDNRCSDNRVPTVNTSHTLHTVVYLALLPKVKMILVQKPNSTSWTLADTML